MQSRGRTIAKGIPSRRSAPRGPSGSWGEGMMGRGGSSSRGPLDLARVQSRRDVRRWPRGAWERAGAWGGRNGGKKGAYLQQQQRRSSPSGPAVERGREPPFPLAWRSCLLLACEEARNLAAREAREVGESGCFQRAGEEGCCRWISTLLSGGGAPRKGPCFGSGFEQVAVGGSGGGN